MELSPSASAAHDAAIAWLMGRINYERTVIPYHERQLKLDRMRQLLNRLGNPDAGMKLVHVAGTKGKGSTSAMIAASLTAAGFCTGTFSSPHVDRIEERFAVDGRPCSGQDLTDLATRIRPVVEAMDAGSAGDAEVAPTFFEIVTAMALVHFADRGVDAAVLEVGLGGRLDATNVCLPLVSVITNISYDHTKQLGTTLGEIASEKAGIIKPGVPVVSGVTSAEARQVIVDVARERGCRLIELDRDFRYQYHPVPSRREINEPLKRGAMDFQPADEESTTLTDVELGLLGPHQAANAAVALATLLELRSQGWNLPTEALRQGLSTAHLPARFEVFWGEPTVVLDSAHNVASAAAFLETIEQTFPGRRRLLILSASNDKDVRGIVRQLVGSKSPSPFWGGVRGGAKKSSTGFDQFIVTQYQDNPRAVPAAELAAIVREELAERNATQPEVVEQPTPAAAWEYARLAASRGELVCITGSFYLAAELRPALQPP
jgi:dihydrofolate synthase/folylpolyglutamate synthase